MSRRILFCAVDCYLDSSNGAMVASRAMLQSLARDGFKVEALTGSRFEHDPHLDFRAALAELATSAGRGPFAEGSWAVDASPGDPGGFEGPHDVGGVPIAIWRGPDEGLLHAFEAVANRFAPEVVVCYGGDRASEAIRARSKAMGCALVFPLHNFNYRNAAPFRLADAVLVPTRFAAGHYRRSLGLDCTVLPYLVDLGRVRAEGRDPRYLTFVNPSFEKGVYAFARIADELGQLRPDIPILVVEGRGTERTLVDCGIDLRRRGNVSIMGHTHDPRDFWGVTKVCLLPSLWWENQPLVAVEAMINGIPVIGSDRGGIPETLGESGVVLSLPSRLTPGTRELPTPEEVASWVRAIIRLWDDAAWYDDRSRRARAEAARWDPRAVEPGYAQFFREVRPGKTAVAAPQGGALVRPTAVAVAASPIVPGRSTIEAGIRAIEARCRPSERSDEAPVFVLSAGWRSGSTMLQRMLMGQCFLWGEPYGHSWMIQSMAEHLRCFTPSWPEEHHLFSGVEGPEALGRRFIANLHPPLEDLRAAHRAYFERLLAEPARATGAARWGLKEVRLDIDHAAYLRWLFPQAKFLLLIRNPYDAWRSFSARMAKGWRWYDRWPDRPLSPATFAAHWRRLAEGFTADHAKVDGLVVRYEDLRRGDYGTVERYLGFPLNGGSADLNPSDGGPPPIVAIPEADLATLDEHLGTLARSLGYGPGAAPTVPDRESIGPFVSSPDPDRLAMDPGRCVILVPTAHAVEPACEEGLRALERLGHPVRRVRGYSAIDQGRNQIATDALRDGFQELMWIDSDIAFNPASVGQLRSLGVPISCGIYPKKGRRAFASNFPEGTEQVIFGERGGLIEIPYAGAGFLHTRAEVYRTIQDRLGLPACNERFGPSMIPFFQPLVIPHGDGRWYLAEDFSFCHRARECGYRIMGDTRIRLKHIGSYDFGWEDAGAERKRYSDFVFKIIK